MKALLLIKMFLERRCLATYCFSDIYNEKHSMLEKPY